VSTSVRRDFISSCCGHYSCPNINTSSAFAAKGKNFKPRREKRRRQRVIVVVVRGSKIGDDQYQDSFQDTQGEKQAYLNQKYNVGIYPMVSEDTRYLPVLYSDGDDDDEPYKSDAGTGSSHSYCPRYTCQPNVRTHFIQHSWKYPTFIFSRKTTTGTTQLATMVLLKNSSTLFLNLSNRFGDNRWNVQRIQRQNLFLQQNKGIGLKKECFDFKTFIRELGEMALLTAASGTCDWPLSPVSLMAAV